MPSGCVPMDQWTPEEISDHIAFMDHVADTLRERGEYVDGAGAVAGGHVRAVRRRGQAAGDRRAVRGDQGPDRRLDGDRRRLASSGPTRRRRSCPRRPARAGEPLQEWIEVRPFLETPAVTE